MPDLGHRTVVNQGFHIDLHKDELDAFSNNLFWYAMSDSGPSTSSKEFHVFIILPFLGLHGLEAPSFWRTSLYII